MNCIRSSYITAGYYKFCRLPSHSPQVNIGADFCMIRSRWAGAEIKMALILQHIYVSQPCGTVPVPHGRLRAVQSLKLSWLVAGTPLKLDHAHPKTVTPAWFCLTANPLSVPRNVWSIWVEMKGLMQFFHIKALTLLRTWNRWLYQRDFCPANRFHLRVRRPYIRWDASTFMSASVTISARCHIYIWVL